MHQIRKNSDGSHRIVTQSEANREDFAIVAEEALVATGSPLTATCWVPAALLAGMKIFGVAGHNNELFGIAVGLLAVPIIVLVGVALKKILGPLSGLAGLVVAYQIFMHFG